jgi:hypothetical protein
MNSTRLVLIGQQTAPAARRDRVEEITADIASRVALTVARNTAEYAIAAEHMQKMLRLSEKSYRLEQKQRRWDSLLHMLEQRALTALAKAAPGCDGGASGVGTQRLTVRRIEGKLSIDYATDVATLMEMSRIETDFARELGQFEPEGGDGADVVIQIIGTPYDQNL